MFTLTFSFDRIAGTLHLAAMEKTKIARCLVAAGAMVLLAGCVTPANQLVWYNPIKSQAEADADINAARLEATKYGYVAPSPFGNPWTTGFLAGAQTSIRQKEIFDAYMLNRGYRLIRRSQLASQAPDQMWGTHNQATPLIVAQRGTQPFVYQYDTSGLEVLKVTAGTESAGIVTGERIVKISGIPVSALSMSEVNRAMSGKVSEKLTVTVASAPGVERDVVITLVGDFGE